MKELNQLFAKIESVFSFSEEEKQVFRQKGKIKHFASGNHLFRSGETPNTLSFICSGVACNYYTKADGTRRNKSFLQVGDVAACLSSLHLSKPTRFSCEALTDIVCFEVPFSQLSVLMAQHTGWQKALNGFVTMLALKKEAREADLLLLSPQQFYVQFIEQFPELASQLPNYHIASYLGITEVSLSRIRAKLGVQNPYNKTV
ncbi:Crp/Fnr family transcriptional regulator [Agaribacterium sp. ZY112]|uniref:Crp/Fnr family transcriptional regulator n=1 Tax=Agaribacterium sp. ZY112 TaxID=3233574 RepID=UPI003523A2A7